MSISTTIPSITSSNTSSSSSSSASAMSDNTMIASNFTTFLTLLTTQLQNQDPLSPMDTNQFTQQLVEFAGVEQQMKSNDELSTLVSLQQSAQATSALGLVGATVAVNGSSEQLTNGQAAWTLNATKPATATISIANSSGQTVYNGSLAVNAGAQTFNWNGYSNDGTLNPDGTYTLVATAVDASGQSTAISTQVTAQVTSVDLTQSPPLLSINGQNYPMSQIQQIF